MKIHEIIFEAGRPQTDPDLIQKIKDLWDSGVTKTKTIADQLGIPRSKVEYVLEHHYPDRPGKQLRKVPEDIKETIRKFWDQGLRPFDIHKELQDSGVNISITPVKQFIMSEYGIEAYNERLGVLRQRAGTHIGFKITDEVAQQIIELYRQGVMPKDISDQLNNLVNTSAIRKFLFKQPNYNELRLEYNLIRDRQKKQAAKTKRLNAKPMSKGIKAIRKIGPVTGGKL